MTSLDALDILRLSIQLARQLPGLKKRPYWKKETLQNYQLNHLRQRLLDAREKVSLYADKKLPSANDIS
jgi:hypothetical protein